MDVQFERAKVGTKNEWLTPPSLIKALGSFDLDPCSPINRPWNTALRHYTIEDDGLQLPWTGRVWCNPPYGNEAAAWLKRCAEHGNAIVLLFNRAETKMFFDYVWYNADAIFFTKGRIKFHHVSGEQAGNPGCGSVLIAYGRDNMLALEKSGLEGRLLRLH